MEIGISYGCLCPPIEEQLREQGLTLGVEAERIEELRKAIFDFIFEDLITDSESDSIVSKLHKKVVKMVKPIEVQNGHTIHEPR